MILDEKIKIKIHSSTITHFRNKGYICNIKDDIEVFVNDLPKQSTCKIKVKCDVCGKENIIQYRRYVNNKLNKGFYVCSLSCAQNKIKMTKNENHNDPNYSGIQKRKNTCKEKYNNENYKNIEKRKQTNILKYGEEHVIMNNEIKEKRKQTYIEIYGVEHPMKNKEIVNKKQETSLKLHGSKNYNNIDKVSKTKIEKGLQIPYDKISEFEKYRRECKNRVNKIKYKLLDDWDGYDYYDGEYIKDNFNFEQTHKNYPTIDHKISVFYGFVNNISLDIINSENNLCFTKRYINSSKGSTCS